MLFIIKNGNSSSSLKREENLLRTFYMEKLFNYL